jgi:ATP/maltotriose-dependent transcriptional regulator MalT
MKHHPYFARTVRRGSREPCQPLDQRLSNLPTQAVNLLIKKVKRMSHRFRNPESGQRLYLSKHTVKTQAISVYRKLGVASRSQAVQQLHKIGLLAG